MAPENPAKKRKASVPETGATKMKKVKKVSSEAPAIPDKKRKVTEEAALDVKKKLKKKKSTEKLSKSDATKPAKEDQKAAMNDTAAPVKKSKKSKKASCVEESSKPHILVDEKAMSEEGTDNVDDQTEALLKGFESDDEEEQEKRVSTFKEGEAVGGIPQKAKDVIKKSKTSKSKTEEPDKPGVVYVGRIPHGFYENEMKEYFSQFGDILKLRMSRNPKTGRSRHYAFIQFASADVAEIVAKTMDNYLLFNHILKVKLIPDEQLHEKLFLGANKRFKKVPWNKMRGRELEQGASEEAWGKRIEKENKRRSDKADKMKEIGYEFESPAIKSAEGVSVRFSKDVELVGTQDAVTPAAEEAETLPVLATPEEAEVKAIQAAEEAFEAAPSNAETSGKRRGRERKRKSKSGEEAKAKAIVLEVADAVEEVVADADQVADAESKPKNNRRDRGKKLKSGEGLQPEEAAPGGAEAPVAEESSKPKKKKKTKKAKDGEDLAA